jgi:hypothetical protein
MAKNNEQAHEEQVSVDTETPQPAAPALDLQDIASVLNLVNVAIKRGAYERPELRDVLDITDKLDVFLQYQAKLQAANAAQKGEK